MKEKWIDIQYAYVEDLCEYIFDDKLSIRVNIFDEAGNLLTTKCD